MALLVMEWEDLTETELYDADESFESKMKLKVELVMATFFS